MNTVEIAEIHPHPSNGASIRVLDANGTHVVTVNIFTHESGNVTVDVINKEPEKRDLKGMSWFNGTPQPDYPIKGVLLANVLQLRK